MILTITAVLIIFRALKSFVSISLIHDCEPVKPGGVRSDLNHLTPRKFSSRRVRNKLDRQKQYQLKPSGGGVVPYRSRSARKDEKEKKKNNNRNGGTVRREAAGTCSRLTMKQGPGTCEENLGQIFRPKKKSVVPNSGGVDLFQGDSRAKHE